jgi:hypothetical protein
MCTNAGTGRALASVRHVAIIEFKQRARGAMIFFKLMALHWMAFARTTSLFQNGMPAMCFIFRATDREPPLFFHRSGMMRHILNDGGRSIDF